MSTPTNQASRAVLGSPRADQSSQPVGAHTPGLFDAATAICGGFA